jgi:hypothetical protein
VILLDPNPALFVRGAAHWPIYNDLSWRIRYILNSGIDGVAVVSCDEGILDQGIHDLFDCLSPQTTIRELWLGAQQTLGRGESGNVSAINQAAHSRGFHLHVLDYSLDSYAGSQARRQLQAGSVVQATELVKNPPTWCRPKAGLLRLAWPAGRYLATKVDDAVDPTLADEPIVLEFSPARDGLCTMDWPHDLAADSLRFIKGPADTDE